MIRIVNQIILLRSDHTKKYNVVQYVDLHPLKKFNIFFFSSEHIVGALLRKRGINRANICSSFSKTRLRLYLNCHRKILDYECNPSLVLDL